MLSWIHSKRPAHRPEYTGSSPNLLASDTSRYTEAILQKGVDGHVSRRSLMPRLSVEPNKLKLNNSRSVGSSLVASSVGSNESATNDRGTGGSYPLLDGSESSSGSKKADAAAMRSMF